MYGEWGSFENCIFHVESAAFASHLIQIIWSTFKYLIDLPVSRSKAYHHTNPQYIFQITSVVGRLPLPPKKGTFSWLCPLGVGYPPECDISSRDFSVSRLFSIFWEYRSRSRKFWSRKKVSVSVSKIFSLKKSLGIGLENIWSRKKSQYRSWFKTPENIWSKKISISASKIFGLKKSRGIGLGWIFWSRHSVHLI